jgi:hypothetical protein
MIYDEEFFKRAPEGTTHYAPEDAKFNAAWYKYYNGNWYSIADNPLADDERRRGGLGWYCHGSLRGPNLRIVKDFIKRPVEKEHEKPVVKFEQQNISAGPNGSQDIDLETLRELLIYHWETAVKLQDFAKETEAEKAHMHGRPDRTIKRHIDHYNKMAEKHLSFVNCLKIFFPDIILIGSGS